MKTFFRSCAALVVALWMASSPARAVPYQVSLNGVFDATAPVTAFSRPGAAWSMSFTIDSNPVPIPGLPGTPTLGLSTTVPFSNSDYRLDGVAGLQPVYLVLYSTPNDGGISLFFDAGIFGSPATSYEALETFGAQIYSGPETSPTIVPGTYASFNPGNAYSVQLVTGGVIYGQGHTTITVVPEPATGLMLLAGGLALGAAVRRRLPVPQR
ncbi:MAG: PEP-CTERM sorting domain-containing protein [Rubrivivax sp.]|jgi:hypothetical protein|nr:PEP-CTERM sorting domain-containing protein [Rubrivivax sp.]